MSLTFKTKEEQEAALMALPSDAPIGTTNLDAWQSEIEAKETEIMAAPIGGDDNGAAADTVVSGVQPIPDSTPKETSAAQPTVPGDNDGATGAGDDDADTVFFGKYKKADLPEELRGYRTEEQMLEQLAHARKYANTAELELAEAKRRLAEADQRAETQSKLEDKLAKLEADKAALVTKTDTVAMTPRQSVSSNEQLRKLNEKIENLKNLSEDDPIAKELHPILQETATSFETTMAELELSKKSLADLRKESKEQFESLRNEFKLTKDTMDLSRKDSVEKVRREREIEMLTEFQKNKPELQTSKLLSGATGSDTVEGSVWKFCNKLAGGDMQDWTTANRIVGAYLQGDRSVLDVCKSKGIFPESFGIKDSDIENYSILTRVDALTKGLVLNSATGSWEPYTNVFGRNVTFPDPDTAYNFLLDSKGIRQKEAEQKIVDAEKNGQQKVVEALARRDTSPATLGDVGTHTPADAGQELSKEQATKIFHNERFGEQMEVLCRQGDAKGWNMFVLYNKALKCLNLPEEVPDSQWVKPKPVDA